MTHINRGIFYKNIIKPTRTQIFLSHQYFTTSSSVGNVKSFKDNYNDFNLLKLPSIAHSCYCNFCLNVVSCIILIFCSRHMLKQFVPGRLTSPDTFTLSQSNPRNQADQQTQRDDISVFHQVLDHIVRL